MIHCLTIRGKLSPSGSLMTTEELPSGCQDRVDWGQEGTGSMTTVRIQSFLVSTFLLYNIVFTSLILRVVGSIGEKPWYLTSRRLVIWEIDFRISDLTPLPFHQSITTTNPSKMSLIDLKALNNDDLKKRLTKQIKVENWTDKYSKYGYPKLIHKNLHRDATCTEK